MAPLGGARQEYKVHMHATCMLEHVATTCFASLRPMQHSFKTIPSHHHKQFLTQISNSVECIFCWKGMHANGYMILTRDSHPFECHVIKRQPCLAQGTQPATLQ